MEFGTHAQLVLLALLVAVAALLAIAPALRIPYPILLVLGGLALGFVPGVPTLQLPPELVLIAILPIAATAIMRRLGMPRRLVSVAEGESLVNDGTALVLHRVAVAAAVAGKELRSASSWAFSSPRFGVGLTTRPSR